MAPLAREIELLMNLNGKPLYMLGVATKRGDLVPAGDKVYLAGFVIVNGAKWVLQEASIIKESGEWKWYGNQRDPAP